MTDPITPRQTRRPRYEYAYNAFGHLAIQRDAMDDDLVASGQNRETTFTYDDFGRRRTRTLPMGQSQYHGGLSPP
ncbi:MAG TPA: hypothetical protein VGR35_08385 [Tepidisphaeraceae bacterium]|nr:hypothetical protein [Tepidisphaeraceae bacterium]